jgi:hypothetical protein
LNNFGNNSLDGINRKTVFELIITKELVNNKWHYVPHTANDNLEETYTLDEALAIISASSEITNLFSKRLFKKAVENYKKEINNA